MDLTLKQLAQKSGIGASLAAFYRDRYEEYLVVSGEGRQRKYSDKNISLFVLIAKHYKDGLDYDQIKQDLDDRYGVSIPNSTGLVVNNNTKTTEQEDLTQSIRAVFIEEMEKRDTLILHLLQQLSDMEECFTGIKHSLESLHEKGENRDRTSLDRHEGITLMMRNMQADKERIQQQRKWWHIFSKK